ncbi:PLD nuclease N-terminal domain-containing protein [Alkalicoccus daliensis]|uniref:Phospholipase_D-nuclease N-terminal n=1 Tax=Alkalicoccus daliensis TaxID=745820 RepID=A0A1H0GSP4_9BACI|nr:PLD nuclease N-terminal domain-containing protein [Alkalicoccus daliensis]SDO09917.1 Phospholipase_D-nuclease N-terminal [Alkalicoccus daliensis]
MEELNQIDYQLFAPIILLGFILTLSALISCIRQDMSKEKRLIWILVIVFINFLGPIIYFIFGRNRNQK